MKRKIHIILFASFIIVLPFLFSAVTLNEQEKESRAFQLQYRDLSEITSKIKPLLSVQGTILIKPGENQIVIQDFPKNIQAIAKLIQQMDTPPAAIDLDFYFIQASRDSGKREMTYELREIAAKLGNFLNFDHYQLIDKHRIKAKEGETTTISLGEEYIVSFYAELQFDNREVIKLKHFRLFKRERLSRDKYRLKKLLVTSINLIDEIPSIIGASSSEKSDKALLMMLTAYIEK